MFNQEEIIIGNKILSNIHKNLTISIGWRGFLMYKRKDTLRCLPTNWTTLIIYIGTPSKYYFTMLHYFVHWWGSSYRHQLRITYYLLFYILGLLDVYIYLKKVLVWVLFLTMSCKNILNLLTCIQLSKMVI